MATESHGAEAVAAGHAAAESAGMPQLAVETFGNQIFWLLVALVATYLILSRVALPRIAAVLAERQGTITNDIAAAEELKLKAKEAEAAYEQALADARTQANEIVEATRADIKADLDAALEKADAEIAAKAAESEKAVAEIRANAAESAAEVAKDTAKELIAALGGEVDGRSVTAAVNARMKG
ncbi:MAG: F0F1 ATP synthase subunit B' [Donghicola eburneus]|nr:F0F1 ATP synthase subunit B' [Donghicola eburneus]MCI5041687.1 F0F1 ATP synthase subunit B' [Donghicola eburneus]